LVLSRKGWWEVDKVKVLVFVWEHAYRYVIRRLIEASADTRELVSEVVAVDTPEAILKQVAAGKWIVFLDRGEPESRSAQTHAVARELRDMANVKVLRLTSCDEFPEGTRGDALLVKGVEFAKNLVVEVCRLCGELNP
jgi:hypothetical protein